MKILAFAASNSATSINKKFVTSVSKYYKEPDDVITIIDLNDFEMPIFSEDREKADGIPSLAYDWAQKIDETDFILISFAEHNGNYSAAYKNITDWVSRIPKRKIYNNKPLFIMAVSDGKGGAQRVLDIATARLPFDGGEILETFSLPSFYQNFEAGKGVTDTVLRSQLEAKVRKTKRIIKQKLEQNK